MFRFVLVRKLGRGWNRCFGSRRERAPLSLQECMDSPPPKRGLWRNWFIFLIVAPALYYLIFVRSTNSQDEYSVTVQRERIVLRPNLDMNQNRRRGEKTFRDNLLEINEGSSLKTTQKPERQIKANFEKSTYYQIQRPHTHTPQDRIDTHRPLNPTKTVYKIENGTLVGTQEFNNSIRIHIPARNEKTQTTTPGPVPRKFMLMCVPKVSNTKKGNIGTVPRNLTSDMAVRNRLYKGGFYAPDRCQPRHKIAVLVPYRNRGVNLAVFLYNIHPFLVDQALEYRIFVIEQWGNELFNKGRLFNVGFLEAQKYGDWGCMVFHDVDLLPSNSKIMYTCPTFPRHMSATIIGKQNDPSYRSLFGGVTSMTIKQYRSVNGYSNLYWGWGGEDTDMFWRIKSSGLPIVRYSKSIAKYIALPHEKSPENPIRKQLSNNAMDRYKTDGLSTLKYRLVAVNLYQTYTHLLVDINPEHDNITELHMRWMNG